jgi:hypothetical protein
MSMWRTVRFSAALLVLSGLGTALPGCGDGATETTPTGEVKIAPAANPAPKSVPVQEEYKSMDPAGKGVQPK